MSTDVQEQKQLSAKRRFLAAMAGFQNNKALQLGLELRFARKVNYFTLSKVMDGSRTTGPEARWIMRSIALLVGKSESSLWPKRRRPPRRKTA